MADLIDKAAAVKIAIDMAVSIEKEEAEALQWGGPDPRGYHARDMMLDQAKAFRRLAAAIAALAPAEQPVATSEAGGVEANTLTVWYGSMPESNGRQNWTAMIYRKGSRDRFMEGYCFARSEYPDQVRYAADRMRWVIGELPERPDILAYDEKLHSGYVEPTPAPVDALVKAAEEAAEALDYSANEIANLENVLSDYRQNDAMAREAAAGVRAALAAYRGGAK